MKIDFIKQLTKIKKDFLKYAEDNSEMVNEDSFIIDICNQYLTLYIEAEDEYGDSLRFTQEVEMGHDQIYQNNLIPLSIHSNY